MSDQWHIIEPSEDDNLVKNPQFWNNITDSWTSQDFGAGAAFARDTTVTYYGIGSAKITAGDGVAQLYSNTFSLADGATLYAQCESQSTVATKNQLAIYETTTPGGTSTVGTAANTWEKLTVSHTNSTGGAVTARIDVRNLAADSAAICYFDGVQAERTAETTYIDGDQPGCEWNGEAHNSTSTRSALSYQGGVEYDLKTDLSFAVDAELGLSAPPISNTFRNLPKSAGGMYDGTDVQARPFTLGGQLTGSSKTDLHDKMKVMIDRFAVTGGDEVLLRYSGGTSEKRIVARYEAGLEGNYTSGNPLTSKLGIKLYAADPYFYQVNDTNDVLDTNDTATLYYLAGRKRSTGQWSNLGLSAIPTADGLITAVYYSSNKSVYFGGLFDGINNNDPVGGDYIIRYDPYAGTWNLLVGGSDLNGAVYCISEGPDGLIYLGGAFTQVNGDAGGDSDYIIAYNPSTDAWSKLGVPNTGAAAITSVTAMAWDSAGNLYIGGAFTNFADVANADYFAKWDGTSWTAVSSGGSGNVNTIAIDVDDNIYIGGSFLNWAADANADYWAWWNGTAWAAVNDIALAANVNVMRFDAANNLYVGGDFTDADSNTSADYIFKWTGTQVTSMGTPPNDAVNQIKIAGNGDVWASGQFTTIGGYPAVDRLAVWNGSTWTIPDINLPGAPLVYDLDFGNVDPENNDNYDVYIGFNTTGSGYFAGDATVDNDGNAAAYPKFILKRSGGTSATLYSIRNETTGKQLYFHHGFPDGETFTIELSKDGATVDSDFLGPRRHAILANSDIKTFLLEPGDNLITCFVDVAGAPTITANCLHKARFGGYDD